MSVWLGRGTGLVMAAALVACSSGATSLATLPPAPFAAYRLGAGDELRVMMPGLVSADAMSTTYVINDRGQLALPLLGDVPAEGRTVPELQQAIARQLVDRQLLREPTVSIQPVKLRPFYVLGEVKNPGEYQYRAGMSVLAAVSVAGGYTFRAQQRYVVINRSVNGKLIAGRAGQADMIQPGDTVKVYEKWF